jgi:surfeit locus 1 family protein
VRRLFAREHVLTSILILVAAGVCARLGVWQLARLAQRRAFNAHVAQMQGFAPLHLPSAANLTEQEYRSVQVSGIYDFDHQFGLRNQVYNGEYGLHLITPLWITTTDLGLGGPPQAVLVDRGWIPAQGNETPSRWRQYDELGTVNLSGVIRLGQSPAAWVPFAAPPPQADASNSDFLIYVDPAQVNTQPPNALLPIYIQLDLAPPASAQLAQPVPVAPSLDLTQGPHLAYAIQWFGFASLLIFGYPLHIRRQEISRP